MRLRTKTLLIVGITLLSLMVFLYVFAQFILVKSFSDLEQNDVEQNVQRTLKAIGQEQTSLNTVMGDWANWDETRDFIQGTSPEFVSNNLMDQTFINLRINLLVFVNLNNQIVYTKCFNLQDQQEIPTPPDLEGHIGEGLLLVTHDSSSETTEGILDLSNTPTLVSSWPIRNNEGTGPIYGTIIMGRFLDQTKIEEIAAATQLNLEVYQIYDSTIPQDIRQAYLSLSDNNPIYVQPQSSTTIAGYTIIPDIYGTQSLIIQASMPRLIYAQELKTMNYMIAMFAIIGISFILVVLLLIEKVILSRIARLNKDVHQIGLKGEPSDRVTIQGNDELSQLSGSINNMLGQLEQSQYKLKEARDQLQQMNKGLEVKVQQRTAEVNALLKQKDEFIDQLSHDLKNPLVPMMNVLYIFKKKINDPTLIELTDILSRNINYMKNLVVNTLKLSQLNSPTVELNIETLNLLEITNTILETNHYLLEQKNIFVENTISNDIYVTADKLQLLEIFTNLSSNAVRFMNTSGTLRFEAKQEQDHVVISIHDNGIGLTEEQLEHVFDEFYKADRSRHVLESSGLGLTICKRIVEKHGGRIWVESQGLHKGTTFRFTLPLQKTKKTVSISDEIDKVLSEYNQKKQHKIY